MMLLAAVKHWEPYAATLAGYRYAMRHGMKVQIVTTYHFIHLQRDGVTERGNVTSVYPPPSFPYALQLWESFGLLNYDLPFGATLDLFCPLNNLHPSHVIPDVIFPSGHGSSCERFPFIYFIYNTCFRHSVYPPLDSNVRGFQRVGYSAHFIELFSSATNTYEVCCGNKSCHPASRKPFKA
jgi:hypothetical protein